MTSNELVQKFTTEVCETVDGDQLVKQRGLSPKMVAWLWNLCEKEGKPLGHTHIPFVHAFVAGEWDDENGRVCWVAQGFYAKGDFLYGKFRSGKLTIRRRNPNADVIDWDVEVLL